MRKTFKRALSLVLTAALLVAVFAIAPVSASAAEGDPEITGNSVTLDGAISVNFFIDQKGKKLDEVNGFGLTVTKDGRYLYGESYYSEQDRYFVSEEENDVLKVSVQVYAKEMVDEITVTVEDFNDPEVIFDEQTYSVRTYARTIATGSEEYLASIGITEKQDELKELCVAMLNYGAKAQLYFNYKTDDLANNFVDYIAPEINAWDFEDIDYSDPDGDWLMRECYDNDYGVMNTFYFVNVPGWESVDFHFSVDEETYTVPMTDTGNTDGDGCPIFVADLGELDYYDCSYFSFTGDSGEKTETIEYANAQRYEPFTRADKFARYGLRYVASSIGLVADMSYSLLFDSSWDYYDVVINGESTLHYSDSAPGGTYDCGCYLRIDNIPVKELMDPIELEFSKRNENRAPETFTFTVGNYIKRALMLSDDDGSYSGEENVALKAVVTALYDYSVKANAYFG